MRLLNFQGLVASERQNFMSTLPLPPAETVTMSTYSCEVGRLETEGSNDPEAEAAEGFGMLLGDSECF